MKVLPYLAPLAALIGVVTWGIHQQREEQEMTRDVRDLQREVVANTPTPSVSRKSADSWQFLAEQVRLSGNPATEDAADTDALDALTERLATMNGRELLAALEEIGGLGLQPDLRKMLENQFIRFLVEEDPQSALAVFCDRIRDDPDGVGSELVPAIGEWAQRDPAAATAWLDRETAAGLFETKTLDPRSAVRLEFEATLSGILLASDPAAAADRIENIPLDQRAEVLQLMSIANLTPAGWAAFVGLTRTALPAEEREGPFVSAFSELVPDGDFVKSAAFLEAISATPEERTLAASWAAGNRLETLAGQRPLTPDDVAATRAWLTSQAPAAVENQLGEALARAAMEGGEVGFSAVALLAAAEFDRSPNDDLLVTFLETADASDHPAAARQLAEKITDSTRRNEILEALKE